MNMTVMLALAMSEQTSPLLDVARANDFTIASRVGSREDGFFSLGLVHSSGAHYLLVDSQVVRKDAMEEFRNLIDGMNAIHVDSKGITVNLGAADSAPIGTAITVQRGSALITHGDVWEGKTVQSVWSVSGNFPALFLVGSSARSYARWGDAPDRSAGSRQGATDKSMLSSMVTSLARWHNSEVCGALAYVDNIQRVAGREMVTKVDKNQNVYVDMNELSRHRGWNFTISLEPARADVRIGNDHIKIYPGADRIHINDELVTLPGTVPTQGYGVYLPLRLLQERGYLPAEG